MLFPPISPRARRALERAAFLGALLWLAVQLLELRHVVATEGAILLEVLRRDERCGEYRRDVVGDELLGAADAGMEL